MKISSGCRECGHNLYDAILKAWPDTSFTFVEEMLPTNFPSMENISLPKTKLQEFNASLKEVGEFAAWVCGVKLEKFNRLDMVSFIRMNDNYLNNYDSIINKLENTLNEINKEELNDQRPGGSHSTSARLSYAALQELKQWRENR